MDRMFPLTTSARVPVCQDRVTTNWTQLGHSHCLSGREENIGAKTCQNDVKSGEGGYGSNLLKGSDHRKNRECDVCLWLGENIARMIRFTLSIRSRKGKCIKVRFDVI